MLLRHWHFADAVEYIRENFNSFLNENKAASTAFNNAGGEQQQPKRQLNTLNDIKDTLSALPQFQELKAKFSIHINISQGGLSLSLCDLWVCLPRGLAHVTRNTHTKPITS
jgi:syntaxin-binding protein 1